MLITIENAMHRYNVSRRTLGRRMHEHRVTRHRSGKTVLVETSELDSIFGTPPQAPESADTHGTSDGQCSTTVEPHLPVTPSHHEVVATGLIVPHPDELEAAYRRALRERKLWPRLFAR